MLSEFLKDYLPIILFLIIALGLSCAFVVVNFILSPKKPDPEKLSAYECGFEPFEDSRIEFTPEIGYVFISPFASGPDCLQIFNVNSIV